jgi:hypothetical protein
MHCYALPSITIPASVNSIGDAAFDYCSKLTTVYVLRDRAPLTALSKDIILSNVRAIYVPARVLEAYRAADGWSFYENLIRVEGAPPTGNTAPKSLTVTGIPAGLLSEMNVLVYATAGGNNVAGGTGALKNGSVTVELYAVSDDGWTPSTSRWTGNGGYYISFNNNIRSSAVRYWSYTKGASAELTANMQKHDFNAANTTIPFNLFAEP